MLNSVPNNLLKTSALFVLLFSLTVNFTNALYIDTERDFNSNNSFFLLSEIAEFRNIFSAREVGISAVAKLIRNSTRTLPEQIAVATTKEIFVFDAAGPAKLSSEKLTLGQSQALALLKNGISKIPTIGSHVDLVLVLGEVPREVFAVGGNLGVLPYKGNTVSNLISSAFSPKTFSLEGFANNVSVLAGSLPRVAMIDDLPVASAVRLAVATNKKEGMVLGVFTDANEFSPSQQKNNLPFLDQLSLSIYCSLASVSTTLHNTRCNYDLLVSGLAAPINGNTTVEVASSPEVKTEVAKVTAPLTPTFTPSKTPTYITQYVTKYIAVPGPKGEDGRNGEDGKDGASGSLTGVPSGFGSYAIPSIVSPSTAIGISAIGYLRDTTIEYATLNYGSSTNMYLANASLSNATFNGSNLFNGYATFTGNVVINDLVATSSNFLNATTTNGYVYNLSVATSTTVSAAITNLNATNATTTNSYVSNFSAASSTLVDASITNSTTTNAYINNLNASTTNVSGTLAVVGTSTLATTTVTDFVSINATSTTFFATLLNAVTGFFTNLTATNATTTNGYVTNLRADNATTTNSYIENLSVGTSSANSVVISGTLNVVGTTTLATTSTTDFIASRATTTSLYSTFLSALTAFFTNLTTTNSTTTNFFATNSVLTNATNTNLFTQNLAVGNASTTGNQSVAGAFTVSGTSTLGANVFLNGNVVVGTSSNETLTVNALVNSNITPAQNITYDLGSPSFYWRNGYLNTLNVNTLSAGSTTISGTANSSFSINTANGSADTQDSSLVFFRGLVTPNAVLRWNSSSKRFESNMSFRVLNETPATGTTTFTVQAGAGQGTTNLVELLLNGGGVASVFNANGWLGIGSSTPSSALTVSGNGYFGGSLTATGTLSVLGTTTLATSGGNVGIGTTTPATSLHIATTDGLIIPVGTTAQRPSATLAGIIRYNTTNTTFEGYNGSTWGSLGGVIDTDQDTYVSAEDSPGADNDQLKFFTAGTQRGIFSSTGLFGIGTTTPGSLLSVNGDSYFAGNITATGTVSIAGAIVASSTLAITGQSRFYDTVNLLADILPTADISRSIGSNALRFLNLFSQNIYASSSVVTNATSTLLNTLGTTTLATSGGNVGIGTTTPASKLVVRGSGSSSGTSGFNVVNSNGQSNLFVRDDGFVGIGTEAPLGNLMVSHSGSNTSALVIGDRSNSASNTGIYLRSSGLSTIATAASGELHLGTAGAGITTNGIRIAASGNVGIGTTTPGSLLSVNGNSYFAGNVYATGTLTVAGQTTLGNASTTNLGVSGMFYGTTGSFTTLTTTNASTTDLTVSGTSYFGGNTGIWNSSGNVGIGTTTPAAKLSVVGNVQITTADGYTGNVLIQSPGAPTRDYLKFTTNAYEQYIDYGGPSSALTFRAGDGATRSITLGTNGYLGVGTSTPGSLLSVNGNSYFAGNVTATGTLDVTATTTLRSNIVLGTSPVVSGTTDIRFVVGGAGSAYRAAIESIGTATNFTAYSNNNLVSMLDYNGVTLGSNSPVRWGTTNGIINGIYDLGIKRNAAGVLEINSGVAADLRDLLARNITATGTLSVTGQTTLTTASSTGFTATNLYATLANTLGTTTLATTAGNVGVGTSTPIHKLDVQAGTLADTISAFNVVATLPSSPTAAAKGVNISITGAGSGSQIQNALTATLNAGFTANVLSSAISGTNHSIGGIGNGYISTAAFNSTVGVYGSVNNNSVSGGIAYGLLGQARASGTNGVAVGVGGLPQSSGPNIIGVLGQATNGATVNIGGWFGIGSASSVGYSQLTSAALIADNINSASPIFLARDNSTTVFSIIDGGNVGIGTTTPGSLLSVNGNSYFAGNVTATGTLDVAGQTTLVNASSTGLTATNLYATNADIVTASTSAFTMRKDQSGIVQLIVENRDTAGFTMLKARSGTGLSSYASLSFSGSATSNTDLTTVPNSGVLLTPGVGGLNIISTAAPIIFGVGGTSFASESFRIAATGASSTAFTATTLYTTLLNATTGAFTNLSSTGTTTLATNGGNVGIGTTTPTSLLSIANSVYGTTALQVTTNNGGGTGIDVRSLGGGVMSTGINVAASSAGITSSISSASGISIYGSGYGSAVVGVKGLTGGGGIGVWGDSDSLGGYAIKANGASGADLFIATADGVGKFIIKNNGTVAVGTSTPSAALSVQGAYGGTTALFDVATTTSAGFATSSLFKVLANGNVGIGTSTPLASLHIQGRSTLDRFVVDSGNPLTRDIVVASTSVITFGDQYIPSDGFTMRINPTTQQVSLGSGTSLKFTNQNAPANLLLNSANNALISQGYDGVNNYMQFGNGQSSYITFSGSGRAGIGTTTPAATFVVAGTSTAGTISPFIVASSSGATLLTVLANGNVGIGSTTPGANLQVTTGSASTIGAIIKLAASQSANAFEVNSSSGSGGDIFRIHSDGTTRAAAAINGSQFSTNSGGNSLSTGGLTLGSGAEIGFITSANKIALPTTNTLAFTTNSVERLRIDATGNVGIGTTTPTSLLSVASSTANGTSNLLSVGTTTSIFNVLANGNVGIATSTPGSALTVGGNIVAANSGTATFKIDVVTGGTGVSMAIQPNSTLRFLNGALNTWVKTTSLSHGLAGLGILSWSNDTNSENSDTGLSRLAAGVLGVGTGAQGSVAGTLVAANVGVGTTTLAAKFAVNGDSYLAGNVTATGTLALTGAASLSSTLAVSGTTTLAASGGVVGIGTTNPNKSFKLSVVAGAADGLWILPTSGASTTAILNNVTAGAWSPLTKAGDTLFLSKASTADSLDTGGIVLAPWSDNRFGIRIDRNGNVGVGTSTSGSVLGVSSSTANSTFEMFGVSTTTTLFNVLANGRVGIGTSTPTQRLSVAGDMLFGTTASGGTGKLYFDDTNGWIARTAATNIMTFAPASNSSALSLSGSSATFGDSASTYTLRGGNIVGVQSTFVIQGQDHGGNTGAGTILSLIGGAGSTASGGSVGGPVNVTGGAANGSSANSGGAVVINGGTGSPTGTVGNILLGSLRGNVGIGGTTTPLSLLTIASTTITGTSGLFEVATSTTLFKILANGNVGIGSTTPGQMLSVGSNFSVNSLGTTQIGSFLMDYGVSNAGKFTFTQGGGYRLALDSGGPSATTYQFASFAGGTVDATISRGAAGKLYVGAGGASNGTLVAGSIGVGTTTPETALHVVGTTAIQATSGGDRLYVNPLSAGSGAQLSAVNNNGSVYRSLAVDGSSVILQGFSGGNVGIGTTTPTSLLSVASSTATGTSNLFSVSTSSTIFNVLANGNVGIGTNAPNQNLSIFGGAGNSVVGFSNSTTGIGAGGYIGMLGGNDIFYVNQTATGNLYYGTNNTTRATITSAGNFGIGTTTPGSLLQVAGTTTLGVSNTTAGVLSFLNTSNLFSTTIRSSSTQIANLNFVLPNTAGTAGHALKTDGVGGMYWGSVASLTDSTIQWGPGELGTPTAFTVRGAQAAGSDITGADITFDASNGTGGQGSGVFAFRTAPSGGHSTFDAVSTSAFVLSSGTATTTIWSHTVTASGSNRILVVTTSWRSGGGIVTGVTYNGAAMTGLATTTTTGGANVYHNKVWYLLNPSTGTNTVSASITALTNTSDIHLSATSFTEVNQSTPFGTFASSSPSGSATSITLDVPTTSTGNIVFTSLLEDANNRPLSVSSPHVETHEVVSNNNTLVGSYGIGSAATTSVTWSVTGGSARFSVMGFELIGTNLTTASTLASTLRIGTSTITTSAVNVGIGTSTPGSRLDVWNDNPGTSDMFRVGSGSNILAKIDSAGRFWTDGSVTTGTPADVAESYSAMEAVDVGTVVAFSTTTISWSAMKGGATTTAAADDVYEISGVRKARYANEAIGVVSTNPGLHMGANILNGVPVALSGRIPVKVTTENGEVKIGDYLTVSSSTPGYAMKLTGEGRAIGRVISDYVVGRDKVMMAVENGYQKIDMTSHNATTSMLTSGNLDLDANGVAIINIKSLASANGTWSIDENGRIVAKILCLEDVCIDKTQLTNILNSTGQTGIVAGTSTEQTAGQGATEGVGAGSQQANGQSGTTTPSGSDTGTPTPEGGTSEPVTESTTEPAAEPAPAEEATPPTETVVPESAVTPEPTPEVTPVSEPAPTVSEPAAEPAAEPAV